MLRHSRTVRWIPLMLSLGVLSVWGAPKTRPPSFLDAKSAGADFAIQGEYVGRGAEGMLGAQVIALGGGEFDAVLYNGGLPGAGWDGKTKHALHGKCEGGCTELSGSAGKGTIQEGRFSGELAGKFELRRIERQSPTLGMKPEAGAIVLFDGKNTDHWASGTLEADHLLGVGCKTKQKFHSWKLHIEFRTPFMPTARGQGRGNSGVYLNDQYECQVLDSFGLTGENNECGGFYQVAKPSVNMCLPPLSWQTYDIDFTAAKYENGKKVANAVTTVRHNGVVIHNAMQLPKATPGGGQNDESQPGAIFLQNHGDPVRFRNIWIVEKK